MRTGFPSHMNIDDLINQFKQNQEFSNDASRNQKKVCGILLRSCGLKWNEFRISNTHVFFRDGKLDIVTEKLKDELQIIINRYKKFKLLRAKWQIIILYVRRFCNEFSTIRKTQRVEECVNSTINLPNPRPNQCDNQSTAKRRKLNITACQKSNKSTVRRKTITIPSNENRTPETMTTENNLRYLLRQEREKNVQLNSDFRKLQEKNLNLTVNLDNVRKDNQRLVGENELLRSVNKT